eukprot:365424-Chlamydomonas_euryale.AAC.19
MPPGAYPCGVHQQLKPACEDTPGVGRWCVHGRLGHRGCAYASRVPGLDTASAWTCARRARPCKLVGVTLLGTYQRQALWPVDLTSFNFENRMFLRMASLTYPPPALLEVHAQLKLSPPLARYASRARSVKSRAWSSSIEGCSFQVEAAWMVTRSGSQIELKPCMEETSALHPTVHAQMSRQVATRGNAGRSIKVGQEVSVQFNLCNEPWLKYTLPAIADRGLKPAHWSSARLLDDVLLLETQSTRFQVVRTGDVQGSAEGGPTVDVYSLSKCKVAAPAGKMRRLGMPLPHNHVDVLEEGLKWEEFLWDMSCVVVRSHRLPVRRMHFMLRAEAEHDDA